jgi:hypothetical protein
LNGVAEQLGAFVGDLYLLDTWNAGRHNIKNGYLTNSVQIPIFIKFF